MEPGPLPNFLIIGAMKSGTSSLCQYFRAHSDAYCVGGLNFFNTEFDRGIDWYRTKFEAVRSKRAIGEKTPEYMYTPKAITRMAEVVPAAKLIAVLRDPVERAYSHYWHMRREGRERLDFAEALDREPERMGFFDYVARGQYLHQLQRVCEHYPRSGLLVLLFEDLKESPAETFAEACRFLGIDDAERPDVLGRSFNPFRGYRARWLREQLYKRRLWRYLPRRAAAALYRSMERSAEYPPMPPAIRARLGAEFAEGNRALAGWLGRDLGAWT